MKRPKKYVQGSYIVLAMYVIGLIILYRIILPWEAVPYRFEEYLFFRLDLQGIIREAGWLFITGIVVNAVRMFTTINPPEVHRSAKDIPVKGFSQSLIAGIFEEISFRWVLLYGNQGTIWLVNMLVVAIFGSEVIKNTLTSLGPLNDIFIGGATQVLTHPGAWTVGLASLLANWKFQQGHVYQGITGRFLSFYGGLVFFRITFQYGLFAAMTVHFLFDIVIFAMLLIDLLIEKELGKARMYDFYNPSA